MDQSLNNTVPTVPAHAAGRSVQAHPVHVTDIEMPFGSMVGFMVKWAIASIPAVIILVVLFMVLGGVLGGLFHSIISH